MTFNLEELPMLPRLCLLLLLCILPAAASGHFSGHAHPDEADHPHPHVAAPESSSSGHPASGLQLQTALVDKTSSADPASIRQLKAGQLALRTEMQRLHEDITALRTAQAQPGSTEIIGGIGYIIGLLGLYAWFRARQRPS